MQDNLQNEATGLLSKTPLLRLLGTLGKVIQTGSSVTGLMVYPDIDFAVHNDEPNFDDAVKLVPILVAELKASAVKVADFSTDLNERASYYIGIEFPFCGNTWHIDATISKPGPVTTNPPDLADWIAHMSDEQRATILKLKKELFDARRYIGSKSRPPHTFRSTHLYEGILVGGAKSVKELEYYFKNKL